MGNLIKVKKQETPPRKSKNSSKGDRLGWVSRKNYHFKPLHEIAGSGEKIEANEAEVDYKGLIIL